LGPEISASKATTKVCISIYNESLDLLERMIEMGFVEGAAKAQLKNLEELLAKLSRAKETKQ
jgi:Fe2+ transport system protein FeoA